MLSSYEKEDRLVKAHRPRKQIAAKEVPNIEMQIRQRAYELFESRGREEGHEIEDWLRAEEEINGGEKAEAVAA